MADGATHERYLRKGWVIILPLGAILLVASQWNWLYPPFLYLNFALCDFIDPDLDLIGLTKSEWDTLRVAKRYRLGLVGAIFLAYSFIYAYVSGSHRSWKSHGWFIGTIGRMIWFNIPLAITIAFMVNHSIVSWDTPSWDIVGWNYYWMNVWLTPYLITQFIAWSIGDGIHLILDTEWAKGKLYTPKPRRKK